MKNCLNSVKNFGVGDRVMDKETGRVGIVELMTKDGHGKDLYAVGFIEKPYVQDYYDTELEMVVE